MATQKHSHVQLTHCTLPMFKAALQCCVDIDVLTAHCLHVLCLAHVSRQDDECVMTNGCQRRLLLLAPFCVAFSQLQPSRAMEVLSVLAGAATSDIIEQYVSTIKTLREVDPTGDLPPQIPRKSAT